MRKLFLRWEEACLMASILAGVLLLHVSLLISFGGTCVLSVPVPATIEIIHLDSVQARLQPPPSLMEPCFGPPPPPTFALSELPVLSIDEAQAKNGVTGFMALPPAYAADTSSAPLKEVTKEPVSTFSLETETESYATARRFIHGGALPPRHAVRIEDFINYFDLHYEPSRTRQSPFAVHAEAAVTPWNPKTYLLKIGVKGYDAPEDQRPAVNVVFLIDVSASMNLSDRLPMVIGAMRSLTRQLNRDDRVSIIVYRGHAAKTVQGPITAGNTPRLLAVLERVPAEPEEDRVSGIDLAYQMAQKSMIPGGINRILLATDGNFDFGGRDVGSLTNFVTWHRAAGVSLSVLSVSNPNDKMGAQLAQAGGGYQSNVETALEAGRVLAQQLFRTPFVIARDADIQVEFDPAAVESYSLIGYRNTLPGAVRDGKPMARQILAGHAVTVLYEISLAAQSHSRSSPVTGPDDYIAVVKLRYRLPGQDKRHVIEVPLALALLAETSPPSADLRFAASVAAFAQALQQGPYWNLSHFGYEGIIALAENGMGDDPDGYRAGFISVVKAAAAIDTQISGMNSTADDDVRENPSSPTGKGAFR